jgi:tetratricopeptide (TPR) repeat protein
VSGWWRLALLAVLVPALAFAQTVPERELEVSRSLYDAGKYAEALARVSAAMRSTNFTDAQRVELLKLGGLAAFNLGDLNSAKAQFLQLLQLNPDYVLDPFAVPPPAIRLFEQVKQDNAAQLDLVRQQIVLRAEQERRAEEERQRLRKEEEERRRRMEALSATVTVRTVKSQSMLVNFVPFGAGQFQQGRTGWGVAFAVSEGVLAVVSIISYFALDALFEPVTYTWNDRLTADKSGVFSITVRRIPPNRQTEADVWRTLKLSSGIGFYALWALGIGEALWHHQPTVVTETVEPAGRAPDAPAAPLGAHFRIFPTHGGLGAGLQIRF